MYARRCDLGESHPDIFCFAFYNGILFVIEAITHTTVKICSRSCALGSRAQGSSVWIQDKISVL